MASVTKAGMRVIPGRNNVLLGFTPYKTYVVVAGAGDENRSEVGKKFGYQTLSNRAMNVIDDNGVIRFVTLDFFKELKTELGLGNETSSE